MSGSVPISDCRGRPLGGPGIRLFAEAECQHPRVPVVAQRRLRPPKLGAEEFARRPSASFATRQRPGSVAICNASDRRVQVTHSDSATTRRHHQRRKIDVAPCNGAPEERRGRRRERHRRQEREKRRPAAPVHSRPKDDAGDSRDAGDGQGPNGEEQRVGCHRCRRDTTHPRAWRRTRGTRRMLVVSPIGAVSLQTPAAAGRVRRART